MIRISTILLLSLAFNAQADEHTHHSHAHEHGIAEMNLVTAGQELFIEVISPAHNVFGFEHPPHTQQQKETIHHQVKDIREGKLFKPNAEAGCTFQMKQVKNPFGADHHDEHEHEHEHEGHDDEHMHKNLTFEVHYQCKHIDQLQSLNTAKWFQLWPQLEKVRVQKIVKHRQSSAQLTASSPILSFSE